MSNEGKKKYPADSSGYVLQEELGEGAFAVVYKAQVKETKVGFAFAGRRVAALGRSSAALTTFFPHARSGMGRDKDSQLADC